MVSKFSDAELLTLAVLQALPGFAQEACWRRHAGRVPSSGADHQTFSGGKPDHERHHLYGAAFVDDGREPDVALPFIANDAIRHRQIGDRR